jgi:hypothetical protein
MSKKIIWFAAVVILILHAAPFANGELSDHRSVTGSYSGSKDMSTSQPGHFGRYDLAASSHSTGKTIKKRNMPTVSSRQAEVHDTIQQLITFSRKSSSNIRREVKRIKSQKNVRVSDAEIKAALDMANKFDRYARELQRKEKTLTKNERDVERKLQTMSDMSQELQLRLQDAINKQQQTMQILSSIMKNQHDTLKSIIRNMR